MANMQDAMKKAGFKDRQQRSHGGRSAEGQRRGRHGAEPTFPQTYFSTDAQGRKYLDSAFVSKKGVGTLARRFSDQKLTTGQIRRFFNHCREIERHLKVDDESWEQVSAKFESLRYHAQNAKAARKIPDGFLRFIDDNVERVVSAQNPKAAFLEGFLPHFEALVGFGAAYLKRDS